MQETNWMHKLINSRFKYLLILLITLTSCSRKQIEVKDEEQETPTLIVTNWLELPERMTVINNAFMKKYPDIKVKYVEYKNDQYDNQMKFNLKAGIAPDIIYLRSYDTGMALDDTGYLQKLDDLLPELKKFPSAPIKAWTNREGDIYAVPSLGVVHGIYYNKRIFKKYQLTPPEDWNSFIRICKVLKSNGELPFAFGTLDNWVLYEVLFSGLGANFYGGEQSRQKVLNKKMFMNDKKFVNTFSKLSELIDFFPVNYKNIGYSKMREMFANEEGVMYIGGSWDISTFQDIAKDINSIGFFAPPVEKKGDQLQYCFHVDIGVAMNRVTRYPEATKKYIKWVASNEYAQIAMDQFPGFFSYTPGKYNLKNSLAKEMESFISESEPTVRTLWEGLSSDTPTGNDLLGEAVKGLLNREMSPIEASEYVHNGLNWYYK